MIRFHLGVRRNGGNDGEGALLELGNWRHNKLAAGAFYLHCQKGRGPFVSGVSCLVWRVMMASDAGREAPAGRTPGKRAAAATLVVKLARAERLCQ